MKTFLLWYCAGNVIYSYLSYLPRLFCDETTIFTLFDFCLGSRGEQKVLSRCYEGVQRWTAPLRSKGCWSLSVDFYRWNCGYWWQVHYAMKYGLYAVTLNKIYDGTNLYSQHVDCGGCLSSAIKKQHCARGGNNKGGQTSFSVIANVWQKRYWHACITRVRLTAYEMGYFWEKYHNSRKCTHSGHSLLWGVTWVHQPWTYFQYESWLCTMLLFLFPITTCAVTLIAGRIVSA